MEVVVLVDADGSGCERCTWAMGGDGEKRWEGPRGGNNTTRWGEVGEYDAGTCVLCGELPMVGVITLRGRKRRKQQKMWSGLACTRVRERRRAGCVWEGCRWAERASGEGGGARDRGGGLRVQRKVGVMLGANTVAVELAVPWDGSGRARPQCTAATAAREEEVRVDEWRHERSP